MLFVCHTTPTLKAPVCSLLSGWTTTTGRLLDPKMALGIFPKKVNVISREFLTLLIPTPQILCKNDGLWCCNILPENSLDFATDP